MFDMINFKALNKLLLYFPYYKVYNKLLAFCILNARSRYRKGILLKTRKTSLTRMVVMFYVLNFERFQQTIDARKPKKGITSFNFRHFKSL